VAVGRFGEDVPKATVLGQRFKIYIYIYIYIYIFSNFLNEYFCQFWYRLDTLEFYSSLTGHYKLSHSLKGHVTK